jgi:uncharacterized repeat protein (TIGR03803 family)
MGIPMLDAHHCKWGLSARFFLAASIIVCAFPVRASATTLKTIYSFCSAGQTCPDGRTPDGEFVSDSSGNLYGTTFAGGVNDSGEIFELVKQRKSYSFVQLYQFCSKPNCADGSLPVEHLILDANGALYGVTTSGGYNSSGTVFQLSPSTKKGWKLRTLHTFCVQAGCPDGKQPFGLTYFGASKGALYDGTSPLYGVTYKGGIGGTAGVAFRLDSIPGKTKRKEKVIYNFCSAQGCADGQNPGGITAADQGTLYGTAELGGAASSGVVFELTTSGPSVTETVLYSFCQLTGCADGKDPVGSVVIDASGSLYGNTQEGGTKGKGTVFKVVPSGANSTETVLHSFCFTTGCTDGSTPWRPLAIDAHQNIYGATLYGGDNNDGVVFQLSGVTETVLYSFCSQPNCSDGGEPAGVTLGSSGIVLGATTIYGGNGFGGTLFELVP